jgi:hypothetical protein
MFSRIVDLHRINVLLRRLERKAQHEIMHRLGCLNVINPLKISFDYSLCLKYLDNRIVLISIEWTRTSSRTSSQASTRSASSCRLHIWFIWAAR